MSEVALRLIGIIHRGVMPCIVYSVLVILSQDKNNQVYSSETGKSDHSKKIHLFVLKLVMVTSALFLCFLSSCYLQEASA